MATQCRIAAARDRKQRELDDMVATSEAEIKATAANTGVHVKRSEVETGHDLRILSQWRLHMKWTEVRLKRRGRICSRRRSVLKFQKLGAKTSEKLRVVRLQQQIESLEQQEQELLPVETTCSKWVQTQAACGISDVSAKDSLRSAMEGMLLCLKTSKKRKHCCKMLRKNCKAAHKTWWTLKKTCKTSRTMSRVLKTQMKDEETQAACS